MNVRAVNGMQKLLEPWLLKSTRGTASLHEPFPASQPEGAFLVPEVLSQFACVTPRRHG